MSNAPRPRPALPKAELQKLVALLGAGKTRAAIAHGELLAGRHPNIVALNQLLGAANMEVGSYEQAVRWFTAALAGEPGSAGAMFNLGVARQRLGHTDEAVACYQRVLQLAPDHAGAQQNLGGIAFEGGRKAEAIARFEAAIAAKPDFAEAYHNLGLVLLTVGRVLEAERALETAIQLKPGQAEALCNLGAARQAQRRFEDAVTCFNRVLEIDPAHAVARARLLHLQAQLCEWDAMEGASSTVVGLGIDGEAVPPFGLMSLDDHPGRQRLRAEAYGRTIAQRAKAAAFARPVQRPERLRIGYFSADFHNHATMHLMARLFELHDRSRFSVHLFSYGPDREDMMRRRIRQSADTFHEVRNMEDEEIATLARSERIDIAVDLKGYTQDMRVGIFAWGAAPVQMSYLGYPGTLGLPYIDYLVVDDVVVPAEHRSAFAEKLIYLPHSYQVNDDERPIGALPSRAAAGLPEEGFVFCCFNSSYKIGPAEFDIWMRLLHRIERSVLWLLEPDPRAAINLRRQAERRGVSPDRIRFAPRLAHADHLARHVHADLFLDTFNVNAHTTASDALWAGLPVLTRAGAGFPARVAASLLRAVGLEDLVVADGGSYERTAIELAEDPARLSALRQRLAANRLVMPLFDTPRFTAQLEQGYAAAYRRWLSGDPADDIRIGSVSADKVSAEPSSGS